MFLHSVMPVNRWEHKRNGNHFENINVSTLHHAFVITVLIIEFKLDFYQEMSFHTIIIRTIDTITD